MAKVLIQENNSELQLLLLEFFSRCEFPPVPSLFHQRQLNGIFWIPLWYHLLLSSFFVIRDHLRFDSAQAASNLSCHLVSLFRLFISWYRSSFSSSEFSNDYEDLLVILQIKEFFSWRFSNCMYTYEQRFFTISTITDVPIWFLYIPSSGSHIPITWFL